MSRAGEIRRLGSHEIGLIGDIARSEYMDTEYSVEEGALVGRPVGLDKPTESPPEQVEATRRAAEALPR